MGAISATSANPGPPSGPLWAIIESPLIVMKSLLALSLLLAAPAAAQNIQYSTEINSSQSSVNWSVSSSIGTVNVSPANFRLAGSIELATDSASAPFTTGSLNGAMAYTDPNRLSGEVPNILPFLPPLATFDIDGLQFHLVSPNFSIDPLGNFVASVILTTTAGTNTSSGLLGSGVEPVYGLESLPTLVGGTLTQSGTTIHLFIDMDVQVTLVDPGTGISVTLTVVGPIHSYADTSTADSMHLDLPRPMFDGVSNSVVVENASAGSSVFLAGSLGGLGSTPIAPLGVTAGIRAPVQAGVATASGIGVASFNLVLPPGLTGRSVWLQALETGRVSNVVGSWVE